MRVPCAKRNNGLWTLPWTLDQEKCHSGTVLLRATCYRRFSRTAPKHRTPGGSRRSRTKRSKKFRGLWISCGEYQRAARK